MYRQEGGIPSKSSLMETSSFSLGNLSSGDRDHAESSFTVCFWKWSDSVSRSVMSDPLRPHGLYPPGSAIQGILQAGILEWTAMPCSRESSNPGIEPGCLALQAGLSPFEPPGKPSMHISISKTCCTDKNQKRLNRIGQNRSHQEQPGKKILNPQNVFLIIIGLKL